jgi:hypothetical protein
MDSKFENGRLYQTERLRELLTDCTKRMRRFVLTKDCRAEPSLSMPEYHRYYADGVQFDNGTIVLYHTGGLRTSRVEVFPSYKDMMISSHAHEYEVHWLDTQVKVPTDGTT